MSKRLLFLSPLLLLAALLVGCGTEPPAAFWNGGPTDTTVVQGIIDDNRSLLTMSFLFENNDPRWLHDTLPLTMRQTIRGASLALLDDPYSQEFLPLSFQRIVATCDTVDSLVFTKDTTCTIYAIERYTGEVRIQCDSMTRFRKDTVIAGDTFKLYDTKYTHVDTVITKRLRVEAINAAYCDFNPDSAWVLRKLAGGTEVHSPDAASAPILVYLFLYQSLPVPVEDTVYWRPDTARYGIHHLYDFDSLLTVAPGVDLKVTGSYSTIATPISWRWVDGVRLGADPFRFDSTATGLHRVSFEVMDPMIFITGRDDFGYKCWSMPVQVRSPQGG